MNFNYNFGLGNGRSGVINRAGDWGDINNIARGSINLFSRPGGMYGLQFGGAVYRDMITPVGATGGSFTNGSNRPTSSGIKKTRSRLPNFPMCTNR